jgi:hypothetical protein
MSEFIISKVYALVSKPFRTCRDGEGGRRSVLFEDVNWCYSITLKIDESRAGPGRHPIWRPIKTIFMKLFLPKIGLENIFEGACPNCQ